MKIIFIFLALLLSSGSSFAVDTGYVDITEIKSWTTKNDIYLTLSHECGGTDVNRYHLSKDDNQQYSLLLSAFTAGIAVSLSYLCQPDGYPSISGVRARKD